MNSSIRRFFFVTVILFNIFVRTFSSFDSISLYNSNDKVVVVNVENFSSTIDDSNNAWLVEFYASWCGHCQTYANTYREIAIETLAWKSVVRLAAINCYGEERDLICQRHGIHNYPTLMLIPPRSVFDNLTKLNFIEPDEVEIVKNDLIRALERIRRKNDSWPHFTPLNRVTLEEVYARAPPTVRLILIVVEKRIDSTGRQTMLDFSKYSNDLSIFRTTTDGRLWKKFNVNSTELPALFVLLRNRTVQRIPIERNPNEKIDHRTSFHQTIRSYINRTQIIPNFDDHQWTEMIFSKNALKSTGKQRKLRSNRTTFNEKLKMIDLESALFHMFHQEIPSMKMIENESFHALIRWLNVLTKFFPGRPSVMFFLRRISDRIHQEENGLTGDAFLSLVKINDSNNFIPNHHNRYEFCSGSLPQFRGYPCALWLLFHTLTVEQFNFDLSSRIDVTEIPFAIRNYIEHYFGCRQCSWNFLKETNDIDRLNRTNRFEAIEYLWKVHNSVNRRLSGDVTEDPEHPKIQFPSQFQCPVCQTNETSKKNNVETMNFLLQFYSKENIDMSFNVSSSSVIPFKLTKKIKKISENKSFSSVLFLLLVIFLLVVFVFCRQRSSCREKRQRYTL